MLLAACLLTIYLELYEPKIILNTSFWIAIAGTITAILILHKNSFKILEAILLALVSFLLPFDRGIATGTIHFTDNIIASIGVIGIFLFILAFIMKLLKK